MEIERKFLVPEARAIIQDKNNYNLEQYYLRTGVPELRIRHKFHTGYDGQYYFAYKGAPQLNGLARNEYEFLISKEEFDALLAEHPNARRICKTRYIVPIKSDGAHDAIEVDVYHDSLEGLVTAELEFVDAESARAWTPPDWIGAEITSDSRYKNQNLAKLNSYRDLPVPPEGI